MSKKMMIIVGVILVIVLGYALMNKGDNAEQKDLAGNTASMSGKCNVTVTYPKPGTSVTFPLVVQGYIDNTKTTPCSWYQNQLRAGEVQISYKLPSGEWKVSGIPVPVITNGLSQSTSTSMFTVSLNLLTTPLGVVSGTPIKLTFTELNVNDAPNPDHFDLNVYAK